MTASTVPIVEVSVRGLPQRSLEMLHTLEMQGGGSVRWLNAGVRYGQSVHFLKPKKGCERRILADPPLLTHREARVGLRLTFGAALVEVVSSARGVWPEKTPA